MKKQLRYSFVSSKIVVGNNTVQDLRGKCKKVYNTRRVLSVSFAIHLKHSCSAAAGILPSVLMGVQLQIILGTITSCINIYEIWAIYMLSANHFNVARIHNHVTL